MLVFSEALTIAHGWHLGYTGQPLIPEEIEAWNYGPVIESLYRDLKGFGSGEITQPLFELEFLDHNFSAVTPNVQEPYLRTFLRNVVGVYGPLTAIQLSNMTNMPGTPWQLLKEAFPDQRGLTIPNELIREHFAAQLPKPA
ncbi:MAG: DUF4065 domain-containing protein [Armatimonadetes bacterium]|nr:DUF4065 domain-containing protein [Akkermansiaceae bacterium]